MKSEQIIELFQKFEAAALKQDEVEYWSARELYPLFGYSKWVNFVTAIEKAKESCEGAGELVADHFADASKMVELGSGSVRKIEDILLTRYACYLVAQN